MSEHPSNVVCACCGEIVDASTVDILVVPGSGSTRITAQTRHGDAALLAAFEHVAFTVNDAMLAQLVDAFHRQGLRCAYPADKRWDLVDDDD